MQQFTYTVQDVLGIHARSAGLLIAMAKQIQSEVTITCGQKSASCKKLFALMGMGIRCGDTVTITVEGSDEESASALLEAFFHENV